MKIPSNVPSASRTCFQVTVYWGRILSIYIDHVHHCKFGPEPAYNLLDFFRRFDFRPESKLMNQIANSELWRNVKRKTWPDCKGKPRYQNLIKVGHCVRCFCSKNKGRCFFRQPFSAKDLCNSAISVNLKAAQFSTKSWKFLKHLRYTYSFLVLYHADAVFTTIKTWKFYLSNDFLCDTRTIAHLSLPLLLIVCLSTPPASVSRRASSHDPKPRQLWWSRLAVQTNENLIENFSRKFLPKLLHETIEWSQTAPPLMKTENNKI